MGLQETSSAPQKTGWSSVRELNRYQWFVFAVAALAWMADCMDQQLFNLARRAAMVELTGGNPDNPAVKAWAGYATSIFLVGWAIGGIVFGIIGDRLGRVRTLTYTILLYSIFTGLSAASMTVWDFCLYRFLTGLGVGGVFAAAVALLAETMTPNARPFTLVLMQALSAVGNCTAAGLYVLLGTLELNGQMESLKPVTAWRLMFLIGLVPAVLVILIQRRLHEPESWLKAKAAHLLDPSKKLGSFAEMFGTPRLRKHALFGLLLAFAGVVGLWGIGFFSIDLQQYVLKQTFTAEASALGLEGTDKARYITGQNTVWAGITSFMLNVGAFLGMMSFGWLAARAGRRPTFALALVLAAASTAMVFWTLRTRDDILWMIPVMGFCQLALFGGYALYFPELFPTRLRATGTSFCYNVGRLVAALGPALLGLLTSVVFTPATGYPEPEPMRYAGVVMCSVFLLGLIALPFLPETKGKPLPE
jgi:MFS family permease